MTDTFDLQADLDLLIAAAQDGADIAMRYFRNDPKVSWKEGFSPVTEADFAVDDFLKRTLLEARPTYGWLSEETVDSSERLTAKRTFVVDPIDGTRAFIEGKDVWCVSVAIVENNRSIAGVLNCPARAETYTASVGQGSFLNRKRLLPPEKRPEIALSGSKAFFSKLPSKWSQPVRIMPHVPSLAYRIAMIASGALDGTFVKPNSHDWDLAAADLILSECGGTLCNIAGDHPLFAKKSPAHGILIAGSNHVIDEMLRVVRQAAL